MAPALVWMVTLLAANPDPGPPAKNCARYAAQYEQLLRDQVEADAAAAARTSRDPTPELVQTGRAQADARRVYARVKEDVARSCRRANGLQYECVVGADRYQDLASCGVAGLPVLQAPERTALARPEPPPPSPERRVEAVESLRREWVRRGIVDVEALGTGSGAAGAEPPAAGTSEAVNGGR